MSYQKAGTATPSLVTDFLEKKSTIGATPEEEAAVNNTAWTVYGGLFIPSLGQADCIEIV